MTHIDYKSFLLAIITMLTFVPHASPQHVRLQALAAHGVHVSSLGRAGLEFDCIVIGADMMHEITLHEHNSQKIVVFAVDAPSQHDVSVWVDVFDNDKLVLRDPGGYSPTPGIPLEIRFAYANKGYANNNTIWQNALHDAIELPAGSRYASFPISSMAGPVFEQANSAKQTERAYLFFYGSLGPASPGENLPSGVYETSITVHIDLMHRYNPDH